MTDEGAARLDAKAFYKEWADQVFGPYVQREPLNPAMVKFAEDFAREYASSSNAALQNQYERLESVTQGWMNSCSDWIQKANAERERGNKAEAERDRLQEALRQIWSRLQADEIGEARILTMAALGDPERKGTE